MTDSGEWWRSAFSGMALDMMRGLAAVSATVPEADFIVKILAPKPGAAIADIPCGGGRLSLELASRGYRVTGIDITPALLDDARRAAAERGLDADFREGDMRRIDARGAFDHVVCFGNSFTYFGPEGDLAFLRGVRDALRPDGTLLLETRMAAECLFAMPVGRRWFEFGDLLMLHETKYEPATGQWTSDYVYIKDGKQERSQATYQIYAYREIATMLASAGLTVVAAFGSIQGEPFKLGSPGLWISARRQG